VGVIVGVGSGVKVAVGGSAVSVGDGVVGIAWVGVGVGSDGPRVQADRANRANNTKNKYTIFRSGIFISLIGVSGYFDNALQIVFFSSSIIWLTNSNNYNI
jgi:hypothetical protein